MNDAKIFVVHAGECSALPDEFNKPCYSVVDGRQFALNTQLNESAVIADIIKHPPNSEFIGFCHYRRHLVLPEVLQVDKIYTSKEVHTERNGDLFAKYHSATILEKFIAGIEDPLVRFWCLHHMEECVSFPRNCFVMATSRFAGSFADWFNSCYRSATALCDECKKFGRYNKRMPGFLMERAISSYIAFDHQDFVPCGLTTYVIGSPWQRGADEMKTYLGGRWEGQL